MLKDDILRELEAARDTDISGQALAERFGVSRNAVWKAVQSLKNAGYDIVSGTNRGYRLAPDCDRLSAPAIAELMGGKAVPVYTLDSVDSTNDEAKRRIAAGEKGCFLVASEEQPGGRGRSGKSFYSPAGAGLYMSLVMRPKMALEQAVNVTSFAAVKTAEAIGTICGRACGIKWVNDIFLDGKKVCGILTEAVSDFETGTVAAVVVGIGINLRASAVPEELRSVVGFLGCAEPVKNRLAAAIASALLEFDGSAAHMARYKDLSVVLGRRVGFMSGGVMKQGFAEDIDGQGALVVRLPDGRREALRSGEISLSQIEGIR